MTFDRAANQDLYPFEPHFLEVAPGIKVHYVDEGKGDPVVFVHGNPTWSFYWRELVKALRDQVRCIAIDHVGCGLSDKPGDDRYEYVLERRIADLSTLIEKVVAPEEKVTLVVHDWGGMIGFGWATKHPERVARIVVTNTSAFRLPATKPLPRTLWAVRNVRPFGALSVRGFNAFAGLATSMAVKQKLDPRVAAGLVAPYDSWANRIATLRFVQDIPLRPGDRSWNAVMAVEENLEKLRGIPMLIAWGRHDFVFDDHFLAEWEKRFPDATVKVFEDAGHYVLEDAAREMVPLVKDFVLGARRVAT